MPSLCIGELPLAAPLALAPMAGITDLPFRQLCQRFGAAFTVSEMVSANPALRERRQTRDRLAHGPDRYRSREIGPVAAQIVGADPTAMAEMARFCVDQGARIIDLNLGCPAKTVNRQAAGSALLRDPALVGRIFATVVGAVAVPVTVKTRTGWSPATRNLQQIGQLARDNGIALLTVHGRTRACGYAVPAEHESLRLLRAELSLPLIANGDIDSPERALAVLRTTGADAVMIGRAALGRPWIFADIRQFLATGERLPAPEPAAILDIALAHLDAMHEFYGTRRGLRIARKHLRWYCQRSAGCERARARLLAAETARAQARALRDVLTTVESLREQAA